VPTAPPAAVATQALPPPPSPLAAELLVLDEARRALSDGDAASSLRQLEAYAQRFQRPVLSIEASVLRLESLVALGRSGEARRLATDLLRAQPNGPYAQRVRSIVASSP
jgi:hypothetical protein